MAKATALDRAAPIINKLQKHFDNYPDLNIALSRSEFKLIAECVKELKDLKENKGG